MTCEKHQTKLQSQEAIHDSRLVRDDNYILPKFILDLVYRMLVQSRGLGSLAGERAHAKNKLLHLLYFQVLVLEEHNTSMRDQSREVFEELIRVGCSEKVANLQSIIRETCADMGSHVVCAVLIQASKERGCGHG